MDIESMLWGALIAMLLGAYVKQRAPVAMKATPLPKRIFRASPEDLRRTAFHEAAHATVALRLLPDFVKSARITAETEVSEEGSGMLVNEVRLELISTRITADISLGLISVYHAGMIGETLACGNRTVNCDDDVNKATERAYQHLNAFGETEEDVPVSHGKLAQLLGDEALSDFRQEVRELCTSRYLVARTILLEEDVLFRAIAAALLEKMRLSREDLLTLRDRYMANAV